MSKGCITMVLSMDSTTQVLQWHCTDLVEEAGLKVAGTRSGGGHRGSVLIGKAREGAAAA